MSLIPVGDSIKKTVKSATGRGSDDPPPGITFPRNTHEMLHLVETYLDNLKDESPGKQLAIGGSSGFVLGFLSGKLGRTVVRTIGLTMFLVHVGERQGWIKVDWNRIDRDTKNVSKDIKDRVDTSARSWMAGARQFFQEQYLTAIGFTAGVLLGLGTS